MKKQKKWLPLKKGDIVDVVAPGFAITDEALAGAKKFLLSLGLTPRLPEDLFAPDIICSNTDAARFKQLEAALFAKDSRAIWCIRGGYGSIRIIENVAKLNPPAQVKLFIGYSDTTTLHNYFNQFWHWPTLHGPLLERLGLRNLPIEQVTEITDLIFGIKNQIVFKNLLPLNEIAKKKKQIRAKLVGGNLSVTQTHLGTRFARKPKGQILFFEDVGERGYRVDKMLTHMDLAGYFLGVKAIVFGEFLKCEEPGPKNISLVPDVLARFAQEHKIPVFTGIEVGHGDLQRPLPLFTDAELKCGPLPTLTVNSGATANHFKIDRQKVRSS